MGLFCHIMNVVTENMPKNSLVSKKCGHQVRHYIRGRLWLRLLYGIDDGDNSDFSSIVLLLSITLRECNMATEYLNYYFLT